MKILDRLDELERDATEGPWGFGHFEKQMLFDDPKQWADLRMLWSPDGGRFCSSTLNSGTVSAPSGDWRLIAESRNALRALIDVARAASKVRPGRYPDRQGFPELSEALKNLEALGV